MASVGEQVEKIRSKNAGPFWLTIDVFCGSTRVYKNMVQAISDEKIASLYQVPLSDVQRYELPELNVIKFSFPRAVVQGAIADRDMHGAQMGVLLAEYELPQ